MTNIVCKILTVLVTNWVTVSRTSPVLGPEQAWQAVYRFDTLNQVGIVATNYVAEIVWKGKTNTCILESVNAKDRDALTRSISEPNELRQYMNLDAR